MKVIEIEVAQRIEAVRHDGRDGRVAYRNGYRERTLDTRLCAAELAMPRLRRGRFSCLFWTRSAFRAGLGGVIQQAWVGEVSTRKMMLLVKARGCEVISKRQVSERCQGQGERVKDFVNRPLEDRLGLIFGLTRST